MFTDKNPASEEDNHTCVSDAVAASVFPTLIADLEMGVEDSKILQEPGVRRIAKMLLLVKAKKDIPLHVEGRRKVESDSEAPSSIFQGW
jgi:hypothetical protein